MTESALAPALPRGETMCEKCVELGKKIGHYGWLASFVIDPRTIGGINELIEKMKAEKVALHPEQE